VPPQYLVSLAQGTSQFQLNQGTIGMTRIVKQPLLPELEYAAEIAFALEGGQNSQQRLSGKSSEWKLKPVPLKDGASRTHVVLVQITVPEPHQRVFVKGFGFRHRAQLIETVAPIRWKNRAVDEPRPL
jgi:hypothetical protein